MLDFLTELLVTAVQEAFVQLYKFTRSTFKRKTNKNNENQKDVDNE